MGLAGGGGGGGNKRKIKISARHFLSGDIWPFKMIKLEFQKMKIYQKESSTQKHKIFNLPILSSFLEEGNKILTPMSSSIIF